MYNDGKLVIAYKGEEPLVLLPKMANRHGLIAGATGTGKTVTLRTVAESFSQAGVPVFLADVKGDLASMSKYFPVTFWDLYGEKGLPLRTTITEMGPTLLARLMELTNLQEDILSIVFKIADEEDLLLLDTKDLRAMLAYVAENTKAYSDMYGNMSKASLNVIQRGVVALEEAGGDMFFGEPALDIRDWFNVTDGKGQVNILDSSSLINNPKMYSTFMLWMLSELFEQLPEVGDPEKPKMVFFFDEAHLLFKDAPKALVQKIEQVVKLIRSKGVGVYFITQNPADIPDAVLAQLGNKIQHALRAYTPNDQKGLKAAANAFRVNPEFDTVATLQELGIGEALISFLQADGSPAMVEKGKVILPDGDLGAIDDTERKQVMSQGVLSVKYDTMVDRDSAYEFLQRKKLADDEAKAEAEAAEAKAKEEAKAAKEKEKEEAKAAKEKEKEEAKAAKEKEKEEAKAAKEKEKAEAAKKKGAKKLVSGVASTAGGTVGREVGNAVGNAIGGKLGKKIGGNVGASLGRGILGTLFGK